MAAEYFSGRKLAFLSGLSLFSVPVQYEEAFGLYGIEAMAASVPIVQPNASAFPEIIETTGGGLCVDMDGPESLAEAWQNLLQDPERLKSMGERGRLGVERSYSMQAMKNAFLEVWNPCDNLDLNAMSRLDPQPHCFEYRRRVEFAETDMAGLVHFSNFFRYMETTEHAFFRSLGHGVHEIVDGQSSVGPVSNPRDFFKPIRFEDQIVIRLSIQEIRRRSLRCLYYIFKEDESGETLVASGRIVTASVQFKRESGDIESVEIPKELNRKLQAALESQKS